MLAADCLSNSVTMVDVYYNLHKHVWSLSCRKTGRIIRHASVVVAPKGARLVVREAGRQRVLAEKRKNVHAFARIDHGITSEDLAEWKTLCKMLEDAFDVSYNPYRCGTFYRVDTGEPIHAVSHLIMLASDTEPPRCVAQITE